MGPTSGRYLKSLSLVATWQSQVWCNSVNIGHFSVSQPLSINVRLVKGTARVCSELVELRKSFVHYIENIFWPFLSVCWSHRSSLDHWHAHHLDIWHIICQQVFTPRTPTDMNPTHLLWVSAVRLMINAKRPRSYSPSYIWNALYPCGCDAMATSS